MRGSAPAFDPKRANSPFKSPKRGPLFRSAEFAGLGPYLDSSYKVGQAGSCVLEKCHAKGVGGSMLQVQVVELQLLLLCHCTQGLSDKAPKLYVAPYSRPDVSDYRYATRHSGERLDGNAGRLITFRHYLHVMPHRLSCTVAEARKDVPPEFREPADVDAAGRTISFASKVSGRPAAAPFMSRLVSHKLSIGVPNCLCGKPLPCAGRRGAALHTRQT